MKIKFWHLILVTFLFFCACSEDKPKEIIPDPPPVDDPIDDPVDDESDLVVLAYVTSWTSIMPNPKYITHINYAFAHVTNSFDGIRIDNESRLTNIVGLKKQKPKLKVLLSIGGWESGRFSEMAADDTYRQAFAADCQRVIEQFDLDGVDLDWEYPTSSSAGISSSPDDTKNFTLLMRDIREAIGEDKLLTLASAASARYVDFVGIDPYIDFVNIMTYDMGNPPRHHSALYPSGTTTSCCDKAVNDHVKAGVPINKLTLGIPFYGHGNGTDAPSSVDYRNIGNSPGLFEAWDDVAKVPYKTNSNGVFVLTYDNPRSIAIKCEYVLDKGMLGAMYWEYAGDNDEDHLRKAVYNGIMKK